MSWVNGTSEASSDTDTPARPGWVSGTMSEMGVSVRGGVDRLEPSPNAPAKRLTQRGAHQLSSRSRCITAGTNSRRIRVASSASEKIMP